MSNYHDNQWRISPDGYLTVFNLRGNYLLLTPEQAERLGRELSARRPCAPPEDSEDALPREPEPMGLRNRGKVCAYPACGKACLGSGACRHAKEHFDVV